MTNPSIFTVGGTVQAGGGLYLPRPADDELLQHCLDGDFCYVLTARQMGKSSLMVRTAETLQTRGLRTVIVDLTRLGTNLQADQWYLGLVDELVEQLELRVDYKGWWQKQSHLGSTQRLSRFLREVVLEEVSAPLVIFIDEIDTTLSLRFADDFFAAIRACYNARSTDPVYKRLSFVLLGVATPGDLIRDPQRTPFNIGTRVDLTDFTLEQAIPLASGLGSNLENPKSKIVILKSVLAWTGGHPYLTQRLCRALLESPRSNWNEAAVAQIVEETFFGERSKQDGNLQFVRDMLTRRAPAGYQLAMLQTLRTLHRGGKVKDEEQAIAKMHLKLSGIVRREGDHLLLRNKIYAHIFDQRWLSQNWPFSVHKRWVTITVVLLVTLLIGSYGTFVIQNYGNDLRGQFTIWLTQKHVESPVKPFQDASGTKMVNIPAGTFQMGGDPQKALVECEKYYDPCNIADYQDEAPIHYPVLQQDFFAMDIYEVTNQQYRECVDAGTCQPPLSERSYERLRYYKDAFYNAYPVIYVSWKDAKTYCEMWRGARLPKETEWEYAARGGLDGKNYPWGDVFEEGQANVCDSNCPNVWANKKINDSFADTAPVGSYAPNRYGLYDMVGNVWEWVDEGDASTNQNFGQTTHILRGGSWFFLPHYLRVSFRYAIETDFGISGYFGFRCARSSS